MFKLVIDAGHGKETLKRCIKSIDPNQTPEWVLNARVAEKLEAILNEYSGIEILRTDDRTGKTDVLLRTRTDNANAWGADFFLSIHHNGGINGGKGGGIIAITYPNVGESTKAWQKELYNALIATTGLKGNRSNPLPTQNLHVCRETKMDAVLLELGFMDSATDVPIILREEFADQCAAAIAAVIVKRAGLKRKTAETLYRVQVGSFKSKASAECLLEQLRRDGFSGFIVKVTK